MVGGAIVRLGGHEVYVRLHYDRDKRSWYAEWPEGCARANKGKTQRECLDKLRRRVREL